MRHEKVDKLAAIYQPDAWEALFERNVVRSLLKIGRCNEGALSAKGDCLPKLPDDARRNLRALFVTFGLNEYLDLGEVCRVQFTGRIHAAVAGLSDYLGAFETKGGEKVSYENFKLLVVQFQD